MTENLLLALGTIILFSPALILIKWKFDKIDELSTNEPQKQNCPFVSCRSCLQ